YFNAEQGTGGLEDHDGEVYAHTGISTNQNPEQEWKCVKNDWPTSDSFTGNRDDTQLTQVDGDPNRYRLEISDIRDYYQNTSTSCSLADDEKIETMNFVFRNADGSKEGKDTGDSDIFVDVVEVSGSEPVVEASILQPTGNPPLYPFLTATDTTVTVSVSADTANVDALSEVRLFVDGTQVKASADRSLSYDLAMDTPNRYQIQAEVEATSGDSTIVGSTSTFLIRTPDVVDEARPPGVQEGINYNSDGSVTLSLYAPDKEFVYAIGDFTDWEIDGNHFMKRHQVAPDSTHWWITLDNLNAGQEYAYQYFVDGELRLGDPFAHKVLSPQDQSLDAQALGFSNLKPYPGDETENLVSVLEPGQQDFNFSEFTPPEHSELVVYELLLRDFLETNSYAALTDTLDYLDRLGVNAIELMPVSNFGGNESWGYNPNFHLALDKAYGPPEDLKQFVEAAHQRGMAVLLDVVYNHATNQSPLVQMYGTSDNPWLNVPASSPFSVFNQLNHGNAFVKEYIDRANAYWLEEFNVDGFRFDLSKGFISGQPSDPNGYQPQRIDNLQRIADHVWSVDPEAHVILEHFGVPQEEQELSAYRADETGGMMLWNNMNDPYSQVSMGFEEDSDISGTYYENRGLENPNYMTYMESHDEQWLMRRNKLFGNSSGDYSVQDLQTALNRQKLVGAFFFPVPGPRMMWQFGELGYGWGLEECLKPGGSGDGDCAANDPGRTAPKPIRWTYRDSEQNPARVRLYKTWSALIDLRNSHDVFTSPSTSVTIAPAGGEGTRRIQLEHDSMDAVVVGNVGVTDKGVQPGFPTTGAWYDYFTGQRITIESEEQDAAIPMAPGEFHIYTSAPVDTPEAGLVPYDAVAPPPSAPTSLEAAGDLDAGTADLSWAASTASDVTGYQVYRGTAAAFDTTGARIATVGPETTSYTDSTISQGTAKYYRVVARDNDGMRSAASAAARVLLRPSTVPVSASRSFGEGSAKSDYRLVALPGQVSRGVGSTLDGEAGEAWQVYWDDGSDEDYLQKFDGSSTFDFAPGRGFWAISESDWGVEDEFEPVSLSEDAGRQVAVVSLRQGWNIIANPLGIDVPWSRVENANDGSLQPLWRFDGSFRQTDTFASAREGEAFYFHNQEGRARLKIPYETGTQEQENTTASVQTETLLALTARGPEGAESTVRVGTSPSAKDGVGAEDVIAPPSQFESLSLRVRTEDEDASRRARSLTRSLQAPSGDEGTVHEVSLRAAPDTPVQLSVENMQAAGEAVRLVNRQTGASHNLRRTTSVELSPSEGERKWALLSGSEAFVEAEQSEIQPESLVLRPNYPNPFREQTTIEYTLPEADDVRIEVYDLLGRRVQTLVDGRRESGLHRATWNGRNSGGTTAASGLYIVRLQAGGTTRSQKATLVR
ncbi:MAG: alpha-amylase family glycosyl hydrolase, partial [Salinibacter sp.]|uniref:alpha-amylase family glycosyl hydrolase n=1 Tax=Salinibacter sp. TaxID=2065818 RepID=UPI002FC36501